MTFNDDIDSMMMTKPRLTTFEVTRLFGLTRDQTLVLLKAHRVKHDRGPGGRGAYLWDAEQVRELVKQLKTGEAPDGEGGQDDI